MSLDLLVYARRHSLPSVDELSRHLVRREVRIAASELPSLEESAGLVTVVVNGEAASFELYVGPISPEDLTGFLEDLEASGEADEADFAGVLEASDLLVTFACKSDAELQIVRPIAAGVAELSGGALVDPQTGNLRRYGPSREHPDLKGCSAVFPGRA